MLVGLNFKNVPKTVAARHQYYMCMQLLSPPGGSTKYLYKGDEIGKGKCAYLIYSEPLTPLSTRSQDQETMWENQALN